jgi:hypothetical protein
MSLGCGRCELDKLRGPVELRFLVFSPEAGRPGKGSALLSLDLWQPIDVGYLITRMSAKASPGIRNTSVP